MPSGDVRIIQGYENHALDILLKTYTKDQIITDAEDIPEIWYELEGNSHRYFCDIFIPHENRLIEVKSDYYILDIEKNIAKHLSSIEYGYEHIIWIIDEKGNIEKLIK